MLCNKGGCCRSMTERETVIKNTLNTCVLFNISVSGFLIFLKESGVGTGSKAIFHFDMQNNLF